MCRTRTRRNSECGRRDSIIAFVEETRPQKHEETVDENGIITVVEFSVNDEGKKVKVRCLHRRPRNLLNVLPSPESTIDY